MARSFSIATHHAAPYNRAVPVYLFTYHTYGSWLADRRRGFVDRRHGLQPQAPHLGHAWRASMVQDVVDLNDMHCQALWRTVNEAASHQRFQLYIAAFETTHVHLLVAWQDDRPWQRFRPAIKQSMTRALNQDFGTRPWFGRSGSRKRVKDREHLQYLRTRYLPGHRWYWSNID